jgi:hypothetical protein
MKNDKFTTSYSVLEKKYQIEEMEKLGINTKCQTFEQCVNTLIYIIKNHSDYNGSDGLIGDITCG